MTTVTTFATTVDVTLSELSWKPSSPQTRQPPKRYNWWGTQAPAPLGLDPADHV
jgi:hypothetical protein